jgi:hypothetical protein
MTKSSFAKRNKRTRKKKRNNRTRYQKKRNNRTRHQKKRKRNRIIGGTAGQLLSIYYICSTFTLLNPLTHCAIVFVVDDPPHKRLYLFELIGDDDGDTEIREYNKLEMSSITNDRILEFVNSAGLSLHGGEWSATIKKQSPVTNDININRIYAWNNTYTRVYRRFSMKGVKRCSLFCSKDVSTRLSEGLQKARAGRPQGACCWNYSDDLYEYVTAPS